MGRKLTVEEVKARVEEVHGDKIEVDWSGYVNVTTNVKCKCNVCGHEWFATPSQLFSCGCKGCRINKSRLTVSCVEEKVRAVHGDSISVDYSKYKNNKTKLSCVCNVCGYSWESTSDQLIHKRGCRRCFENRTKISLQMAKDRVLSKHGKSISVNWETYDGVASSLECSCNVCGYVWASTLYRLSRSGCKKCAANKRVISVSEIKRRIEDVHGSSIEVDYSLYTDTLTKLHCKCNVCQNTWETTAHSLFSGHGCNVCGHAKCKLPVEDFLDRIKEIHQGTILVDPSNYEGVSKPVKCTCNICGHTWYSKPNNLIRHGCPKCSREKRKIPVDNLLAEISRVHGDKFDIDMSNYIDNDSKLKVCCNECGSVVYKSLKRLVVSGCKVCASISARVPLDEVLSKINKNFHGEIEIDKSTYKGASSKVTATCKKCNHTWEVQAGALVSKHGCPKCGIPQRFKYEEPFDDFLNSIGLSHSCNKTLPECKNPTTGKSLFFDFLIPEESPKVLIEIDGIQHFMQVYSGNLETNKSRDIIKNKYAKDNGLLLIRVSDLKQRSDKHVSIHELETVLKENTVNGVLDFESLRPYDFNR